MNLLDPELPTSGQEGTFATGATQLGGRHVRVYRVTHVQVIKMTVVIVSRLDYCIHDLNSENQVLKETKPAQNIKLRRMHSSRMRTTCLGIVPGGGRCCPGGGVVTWTEGGVVTWAGGGVVRGAVDVVTWVGGGRCCPLFPHDNVTYPMMHFV